MVEYKEPDGNVEQTEAYHGKTHHGAATEGNLQSCVHALTCCVGRTGRSIGGGLHSKESGQAREETTSEEGKRNPRVLYVQPISHKGEEGTQYHEDNTYYLVLLLQISHSTFTHIKCNLSHTRCTLVGLHHTLEEEPRHAEGYK